MFLIFFTFFVLIFLFKNNIVEFLCIYEQAHLLWQSTCRYGKVHIASNITKNCLETQNISTKLKSFTQVYNMLPKNSKMQVVMQSGRKSRGRVGFGFCFSGSCWPIGFGDQNVGDFPLGFLRVKVRVWFRFCFSGSGRVQGSKCQGFPPSDFRVPDQ